MTIDKEQLISLLIDKTGLEHDEVEKQLSELINRIQQAAEKGKSFEIEGFGVFNMEEGNLQFEPSDTLETEINNKYAGMKPIELIGAFKEPDGDEVPEMPEEDVPEEITEESHKWAFDKSAVEKESTEEPVAQESEEVEESIEQSEREQESVDAEVDAKSVYEKIFGTEEEQRQREFAAKQEAEQEQQDEVADEAETDILGRLLVTAVVVIALGVGGWLVYDTGILGNSNTGQMSEQSSQQKRIPAQQAGDTQEENGQDSPSQNKRADKTSEPQQQKQVVKQEGSTEAQQENRFGLKGDYNQSIGGYTIVVHSLRSMRVAENNKQALQDAGFRALINKAEVGGTTYYRVGIGQFQTVDDAQQAVRQLPERYRENNFIKRIR